MALVRLFCVGLCSLASADIPGEARRSRSVSTTRVRWTALKMLGVSHCRAIHDYVDLLGPSVGGSKNGLPVAYLTQCLVEPVSLSVTQTKREACLC